MRGLTATQYMFFWGILLMFVFLTLIAFIRTLRLLNRNIKLQAARDLLSEIGDEEVRRLRSWVLDEMNLLAPSHNEEDYKKARRVAVSLDRVGYMVRHRLVDEVEFFVRERHDNADDWEVEFCGDG